MWVWEIFQTCTSIYMSFLKLWGWKNLWFTINPILLGLIYLIYIEIYLLAVPGENCPTMLISCEERYMYGSSVLFRTRREKDGVSCHSDVVLQQILKQLAKDNIQCITMSSSSVALLTIMSLVSANVEENVFINFA